MRLAEALLALDRAVTSVSDSRAHLTQQRQVWVTAAEHALEGFAHGLKAYALSDGGRSRVLYSIERRWCALSADATEDARDRFELALPERRALEAIVAAWLDTR